MSKQYLNNRWCCRCPRNTPTPYLKRHIKLFPKVGKVLDIGCGNGRNSKYMIKLGYKVDSIDMVNDFGKKIILGKDPLPKKKYDIFLANFVLMFLNQKERYRVMKEINERAKKNSILMIEMYPATKAYKYDMNKIIKPNFPSYRSYILFGIIFPEIVMFQLIIRNFCQNFHIFGIFGGFC